MIYPEKNVIFIENTSSGKSSLLNKLFGYDLPTGKGETTKQFSCIHKINNKINVYDSVGYNDQSSDDLEQYRQQINQINYCKIVFVCFEGSLKSLKALVEIICKSRNRMYKVAFIYTKCDLMDLKETPIAQCIAQQRRYLAKIGALDADKYPFFASSKLGGFDNQKIKQLINQQYKE